MMHHVVQPGGGGGKMRVRYTACRKCGLVAASRRMMAEGVSLHAAASELRVSVANLLRWALQGVGKINPPQTSSFLLAAQWLVAAANATAAAATNAAAASATANPAAAATAVVIAAITVIVAAVVVLPLLPPLSKLSLPLSLSPLSSLLSVAVAVTATAFS
jgi:hypothetical protein